MSPPDLDDLVEARFVERPNRFVLRGELDDGSIVDAYLPNTGRLTHLTEPGRPFILRKDGFPPRTTRYTATRAWDGCWVALEASRAPDLLVRWLEAGNNFPDIGPISTIEREVPVDRHRLDLRLTSAAGERVWVEVKSGGRGVEGTALLSLTPSARGVAHLDALAKFVEAGESAAAAFVVQRPDVERLLVGGYAHPEWITAVRAAQAAGVLIAAFGCNVSEREVDIKGPIPVVCQ